MIISEAVKQNGSILALMEKKSLSGQYTFRIPTDLEDELERIAKKERRKRSDIARFLLARGLEEYNNDGDLFGPPPQRPSKEVGKKGGAA